MLIPNIIEVLVQFLLGSTSLYVVALAAHTFFTFHRQGKDTCPPVNHIAWFWQLLKSYSALRDGNFDRDEKSEPTNLHRMVGMIFLSLGLAVTLTLGSFVLTIAEWATDSSSFEKKDRVLVQSIYQEFLKNETARRVEAVSKYDGTCFALNGLGV
jgi:hypothetical protein